MIQNIEEVYCLCDNFVKYLNSIGIKKHPAGRKSMLCTSEYMLIILIKHSFSIRTNSSLYFLIKHYGFAKLFSTFPSYQQFNEGIRRSLPYLIGLTTLIIKSNKNKKALYHLVDSTPIPVCSNGHRYNVKIDKKFASAGKNLNGWFYGFKLHLIVNHNLDIMGLKITNGSTKDFKVLDGDMVKNLIGWIVGDKGYISSETSSRLAKQGLILLVKPRKNMKKYPATKWQNFLFAQREKIEGIFGVLKLRFNLVTNLARSIDGFFTSVFGAIVTFLITRKSVKDLCINSFEKILIS